MNDRMKMWAMGTVTLISLATVMTLSTARAQQTPAEPQQGFGQATAPAQAGGQAGPVQGGQFRGFAGFGGGAGGGSAMVEDGTWLFVLQGNRVYRLNKGDLKVAAQADLPVPQMQLPAGFGQGQGGRGGQNRGGGQNGGGGQNRGGGTPPPAGK